MAVWKWMPSADVVSQRLAGSFRPSPAEAAPRDAWRVRATRDVPEIGLFALGALLGLSQLVGGVYDETAWEPIALGALALVLALAVAQPRRPALALLLPVTGLWLWSLISSGWSASTDNSIASADRWLLYAATLTVLWWALNRDRRRAMALMTGAGAGVLGVGIWMLARLLSGHGPALFLGPRLNDPLGYINGEAGYLLVGAWPFLAMAERRGTKLAPALAGIGTFGFVLLIALGLLAQSRSWEVALVVAVVLLVVVVPGQRRRAGALLLAGATLAVIYRPLAGVWQQTTATGLVTRAATHRAAAAILIGALAAGAVWGVVVFLLHRVAPAGSRTRTHVRRLASTGLAALGLAAAVVVGVRAGAIAHRVHTQYEALVRLAPASGSSRLFSGAGNRYDYWRVAVIEFRSAPLIGVGAANYDPGYYLHRKTTEAITQPHSIELQTLAELGAVGFILLAAFLVAVAVGLRRTARAGRDDLLARSVAVAAGGTFTVWLVQTSVDWMHLIPGLTAIALAAAVALVSRPSSQSASLTSWARIAGTAVALAIAVAGTVTIAPRILSVRAQASAQRALAHGDPRAALVEATTALKYDSSSVPALVLRSAAFARLHAFEPSLADLKRAVAIEPRNWVTWALLGDLLTRRGERTGARSAYGQALALDPLEPDLRSALSRAGR
ncbi:MAG: O-antigen ligase family protein [Solirubrobacteraceae bacterium]